MAERISKRLVELIAYFVGAILTHLCCVVDEVAGAAGGEEFGHVLPARLAGWGGEAVEL